MAAKLKSILRTTPWSLLLKASVLAALWPVLPYWLFFFLALGFYFIPFFEPRRLFLPFVLFLFFAAFLTPGYLSSLFLGIIFFLILGVKNLVIVDRAAAYETLFFVLFFLAVLGFFGSFDSPRGYFSVFAAAAAAVFALLLGGFLRFSTEFAALSRREKFLIIVLPGVVIWQWFLAVLILPMNYFYQSALVFLGGIVLAELIYAYINKSLERRKILIYFSVFFAAVAIILAANPWNV